MPVQEINFVDQQGGAFDINEDGARVTLARGLRKFILKNAANEDTVYFTLGKAGLLSESAVSVASSLSSAYPYLEGGETLEFENGLIRPETLEFKTAVGEAATGFRVLLF